MKYKKHKHDYSDYDYEKIGNRILYERKLKKISQEDFSGKIKISRNTISKLENGDIGSIRKISLPQLLEIAKTLDCDISYLLGEYDEYKTIENKEIGEKTGLSDQSINAIESMDDNELVVLNALLSNGFISRFNSLIMEYFLNMGTKVDMLGAPDSFKNHAAAYVFANNCGELAKEVLNEKEVFNSFMRTTTQATLIDMKYKTLESSDMDKESRKEYEKNMDNFIKENDNVDYYSQIFDE